MKLKVYTKERGLKTLKEGITLEIYRKKYPSAIKVNPPSIKTIEKWDNEGYSKTPCNCKVEPDGICEHGNRTWLDIILF